MQSTRVVKHHLRGLGRLLLLGLAASCVSSSLDPLSNATKGSATGGTGGAAVAEETGGTGGVAGAGGGGGPVGAAGAYGGAAGGIEWPAGTGGSATGGTGGTATGGTGGTIPTGGTGGVATGGVGGSPGLPLPQAPLWRPESVRAACAKRHERSGPEGEALRAALTRRWLVCSDIGLFHRPQAGFELRSDGRISLLGWTAEGRIEVLRGADNEGTFTITPPRQANFTSDLGGTVIAFPVVSQNPGGLWINNNGAYFYDYVAAEDVDLSTPPIPPSPPPPADRPPQCQRPPGRATTPGTVASMRQALTRRWLRCSEQGLFGAPEEAGIEIGADDRYFHLRRDAQGQLERFGSATALMYIDTSEFNGHPSVQVNFAGGSILSHPVVTTDPTYLIINNNGVVEYRYVALE